MNYAYPGDKLYMAWTYGEVYAVDGLEDAMNINRSSFKPNHPHIGALRDFLHDYLRKTVFTRSSRSLLRKIRTKTGAIQTAHEQVRNKMVRDGFGPNYSST